jgi:hypothetical protein
MNKPRIVNLVGRMSLGIGGFDRGRKQGREEALAEVKQALNSLSDPPPKTAKTSNNRGVGRPSGHRLATADAKAMKEIREKYPGRNFVHLFKQSVQTDHPEMQRTSVNRRAREAKALLDG